MDIEALFWVRQRDNHALLRQIDAKQDRQIELISQILILLATINRTQASPMSSSPPTASPSILQRSLEKIGREAIVSLLMWAVGKLGLWLFTLVIPSLVSFGALAWMVLRRWLAG